MIRKIVGLITLIGFSLFVGCEDPIEPIEFELNSGLTKDGNGYYHMTLDTTNWQTLHRIEGRVLRNNDGVNVKPELPVLFLGAIEELDISPSNPWIVIVSIISCTVVSAVSSLYTAPPSAPSNSLSLWSRSTFCTHIDRYEGKPDCVLVKSVGEVPPTCDCALVANILFSASKRML